MWLEVPVFPSEGIPFCFVYATFYIYTVCLETELSVQKWDSNLPPQVADLSASWPGRCRWALPPPCCRAGCCQAGEAVIVFQFFKQSWKSRFQGRFLAVQWLGLGAFTLGVQAPSLVRELRSQKLCSRPPPWTMETSCLLNTVIIPVG